MYVCVYIYIYIERERERERGRESPCQCRLARERRSTFRGAPRERLVQFCRNGLSQGAFATFHAVLRGAAASRSARVAATCPEVGAAPWNSGTAP